MKLTHLGIQKSTKSHYDEHLDISWKKGNNNTHINIYSGKPKISLMNKICLNHTQTTTGN